MRVAPGPQWRCANGADIIAVLDAELPPDPAGKVGEGGRDGIGHRGCRVGVRRLAFGGPIARAELIDRVRRGSAMADQTGVRVIASTSRASSSWGRVIFPLST